MFVIRYEDGCYNQGNGFPVKSCEDATKYPTMAEAVAQVNELTGVMGIYPVDTIVPQPIPACPGKEWCAYIEGFGYVDIKAVRAIERMLQVK